MSDLSPFIESLKARMSIVDVIRPHLKLTKKGRSHLGLCPFHGEKSPSFNVSEEKGFFHCFGCGASGDQIDFVMRKNNLSFVEAVEHLASLAGMTVPKPERTPQEAVADSFDKAIYDTLDAACRWYESQLNLTTGSDARDYLTHRGLTPESIRHFRLGFAPSHGLKAALEKQGFPLKTQDAAGLLICPDDGGQPYERFRDRIIFPILDAKGRVIAFGGRLMKAGEPKYLNSPETPVFAKGRTLYAYPHAISTIRAGKSYLVVEGYMDVITLHQNGYTQAVAPLGTALTSEQLLLMWRANPTPILCFDGDNAGRKAAERAALRALNHIKPGNSLSFCFLPNGEDPDSLLQKGGRDTLDHLISKASPLVDVLWQIFLAQHTFSTPEEKATARADLFNLTREIHDADVRHFYQDDLNGRLAQYLQSNFISSKAGKTTYKAKFTTKQPPSPKKNFNGDEILLATLINHPTLISEVTEQLVDLSGLPPTLGSIRDELVSIASEKPDIEASALVTILKSKGFGDILLNLLAPGLYFHARFAQQSESEDVARQGWQDLWHQMVGKQQLTNEIEELVTRLGTHFDERTWLRLKELKIKMAESNNQRGDIE
jgi:DNA primase